MEKNDRVTKTFEITRLTNERLAAFCERTVRKIGGVIEVAIVRYLNSEEAKESSNEDAA